LGAAHEPASVAMDKDFSVRAIDIAVSQKNSEWEMMKEVALATHAEKSASLPPLGSSPMAPRFSKPVAEELPPLPLAEDRVAKKSKKKPAGKKKQALKNEDPKPSSVA